MEDIRLIYPKYEEIILINYFTSVVLKKNNEKGKFIFENDILKINWNKHSQEELFIKNDNILDDLIYSYKYIKDNNIIKINENYEINNENDEIKNKNINNIIYNGKKINIFFDKKVVIFLINKDNNKISNIENNSIIFDIKIINNEIINIKLNNEYYNVFELTDDVYYDNTYKFNETIEVKHNTWIDYCIINKYNNFLYRLTDNQETAYFDLNDEKLIIYWKNWDSEIFFKNNNIYEIEKNKEIEYEIEYKNDIQENESIENENKIDIDFSDKIEENKILNEIYIYHNHWNEICIIDDQKIYRKNNKDECGDYEIKNNRLIILWKLWSEEIFYKFNEVENKDDEYYYEKYIKNIEYNNDKYFINTYNNKIYNSNYFNVGKSKFEEKKIIISFLNSKEKEYDFIEHDDTIIIYENIFKEITIIKDFEEKYIINLINFKINDKNNIKNGNYEFNNNIINIFWDNLTCSEEYIFNNNKYYYKKYYDINNTIFYLFDDSNYKILKIDTFNNFFHNDDYVTKIKFLNNNAYYYLIEDDILKTYLLNNINYNGNQYNILINNDIYNNINDSFDYLIYKEFNKNLRSMNIIEVYNHWIKYGINEGYIYSVKSFLNKNDFFNINQYMINNSLKNKVDALFHFNNNHLLSNYFYSKEMIEVVYNNIFKSEKIEKIENKNSNNEDYFEELFFDDNILYILNINNESDLDKFNYFEKNLKNDFNIIINVNFESIRLINFENEIINKYNNLILCKSRSNNNFYILEFIIQYLLSNNIIYNKVIYINNFDKYFENSWVYKNQIVTLNNKKNNILKVIVKINYFYYLINYSYSKVDIIQILIFYYLFKINVYQIGNYNFISKFTTLKNIINNNFSEKIIILK